MQITPLVLHAARRIPGLTGLFSTRVPAGSMQVEAGGLTTITTTGGFGPAVGQDVVLTIVDVAAPNPITVAERLAPDQIKLTTLYDHDLTGSNPNYSNVWDDTVKLSGFGPLLDGTVQLSSVLNRRDFVVVPHEDVDTITIDGGETLLESMEGDLVGYHRATAASANTLTFQTPPGITRSYTVLDPVVALNPRIFGTLELATLMSVYVREEESRPANELAMFIAPSDVRTSRSRNTRGDALADVSDGSDYRLNIVDGFDVFVVIPTGKSMSAVAAIDAANGPVLRAVLGTFYGYKPSMPELCGGVTYAAIPKGHAAATYTKANYVHRYSFEVQAQLTNADAIPQFDLPDFPVPDWASGGPDSGTDPGTMPDTLNSVGTTSLFDILVPGLKHDGKPGQLSANINMDAEP